MGAFFESLKAIEKVFFISAVLGGALFLVRLVLMFIGGDHGDSDAGGADIGGDVGGDLGGHMGGDMGGHDGGIDSHDGDTDASFKAISLQSLTAFFMMFGLVGLALSRQSKFSESLSVFGAVIGGVLSVWLIGKTLASMRRLQSEGTLDIRNAIGQEGTVYLSIPANGRGVVQINVQDTLRELSAVSHDKTAIKTGERIIVEDITGGNILVVKTV